MAAIPRRSGRPRRIMADINVVPYIDVMLVLLVIFMVAAPLVNPGVVNLPSVGGTQATQQPPILVTIAANQSLTVRLKDGSGQAARSMSAAELTTFVKTQQAANPNQPVVIAADKTVPYDAVMQVMAQLKENGINRVGLMVKSK